MLRKQLQVNKVEAARLEPERQANKKAAHRNHDEAVKLRAERDALLQKQRNKEASLSDLRYGQQSNGIYKYMCT